MLSGNRICTIVLSLLLQVSFIYCGDWPQRLGNALRSGDASRESLESNFRIVTALPLSDAVMASPVISDNLLIAVDAAGVVHAFDTNRFVKKWTHATHQGAGNCNNVSSPVLVDGYVHVGTMSGKYVVLDQSTGELIREIDCGEPIFASPVVDSNRVYFTTLGAVTRAVSPRGDLIWSWDFVEEVIGFRGNRWSGADWLSFRGDRVTWRDHFVCSRDICMTDRTLAIPAGGRTVFLRDAGEKAELIEVGTIPSYAGTEYPATFGQSMDRDGNVYVQWHRRDNAGRVEVFQLGEFLRHGDEPGSSEARFHREKQRDGSLIKSHSLSTTETSIDKHGLLGFSSPTVRGDSLYRVKPEMGAGLLEHDLVSGETKLLHPKPGLASPVL
ncbi:MAG: PQQ-binding-like beta-propeller repeat protein, partial [Rubripirellula sp.]